MWLSDADPPYAGRVFFEGVKVLEKSELLERMAVSPRPWSVWGEPTRVKRGELQDDARRIENMYKRAGYYDARATRIVVTPREHGFVDISFHVEEGRPTTVTRVADIVYPEATTAELEAVERANPLAEGDLFSEQNYLSAAGAIERALRNNGYYGATVTPNAFVIPERYDAHVTYTVFDGPRVRFGAVTVTGLNGVSRDVVLRELKWREGSWYSERLVENTIEDLYGLNLFRVVRIQPRYPDGATSPMPIEVSVSEGPSQSFRTGVGYSTDEYVRAQARYDHYNFLGDGRRLLANVRASFLIQTAEVTFLQPYIFDSANSFSLTAEYWRERVIDAYSFERYRLTPRLNRRIGRRINVYGGYSLEYSRAFDVTGGIPLEGRESVDPGLLSGPIAGAEYVSVDSLLAPTRGNLTRVQGQLAGTIFGGAFSFYRWQAETHQYFSPIRRWVYLVGLTVGAAEAVGASRVPLYDKFYSGGDESVRGYRRDRLGPAIGGLTLFEATNELRYRFSGQQWVAAFVDMGMVGLAPYSWEPNQVRWGVGPGYRASTIVGLLRVDLGIPLQPRVDEPKFRIHLSIGQAF